MPLRSWKPPRPKRQGNKQEELVQIRAMFIGFLPFQKARIRAYMLAQTRELGAATIASVSR